MRRTRDNDQTPERRAGAIEAEARRYRAGRLTGGP
jgi:hypothetical protein